MTLTCQQFMKQTCLFIIFYPDLVDVLEVAQLARPADSSRGLVCPAYLYLDLSWLQSLWKMNSQILFLTPRQSLITYTCTGITLELGDKRGGFRNRKDGNTSSDAGT